MNNRRVKFGLKLPNRWGKCQKTLGGDFFLTHTVHTELTAHHPYTHTPNILPF